MQAPREAAEEGFNLFTPYRAGLTATFAPCIAGFASIFAPILAACAPILAPVHAYGLSLSA